MAKPTRRKSPKKGKTKSIARTKKARSRVKQKRKVTGAPLLRVTHVAPISVVSTRAAADPNAKSIAVIHCVNSAMDANQPGWNSDDNGNNRTMDYFGYNTNSMPAFLGVVAHCLAPTYTVAINSMNMSDCVSATVLKLKTLVNKYTS